ncbi:anaphase promoting complex subunit doc1 [Trapelia coarctata]|nr:anaphase promoting complex subunit doc1 [Trapelia coarctata]
MVEHSDRPRVSATRTARLRRAAPHVEPPASEHSESILESTDEDEDDPSSSLSSPPPSPSTPHPSTNPTHSPSTASLHSHLREISSLASWTVSTYKPGCGVSALLSPSTSSFWQSDGPQPHLLNIHFFKLVHIVKLRVYLDSDLDESYTPTKMVFAAGMGEYDLVEFAEWKGESPRGWVDIGLGNCAPEEDGGEGEGEGEGVLRCMCLQVRVLENHQNGKDTHIRGVQIFAWDERVSGGLRKEGGKGEREGRGMVLEDQYLAEEEPEWR